MPFRFFLPVETADVDSVAVEAARCWCYRLQVSCRCRTCHASKTSRVRRLDACGVTPKFWKPLQSLRGGQCCKFNACRFAPFFIHLVFQIKFVKGYLHETHFFLLEGVIHTTSSDQIRINVNSVRFCGTTRHDTKIMFCVNRP
jgi:hypothetical protein